MANFLTEKLGPLPTWGWMALATAGVGGYVLYSKHEQSSSQQQVQASAALAAQQASATAAAAAYQPYTVPYVTSASATGSSGGTYGNGYRGPRRRPQGAPQIPPSPVSAASAMQPAMAGTGSAPQAGAPQAPASGTRNLGRGAKIIGGPGHFTLLNKGKANPLGSGITSLSQADSYAQQFGAP